MLAKISHRSLSLFLRHMLQNFDGNDQIILLGEWISDLEGREYRMAGVIPLRSRIDKPRLSLGYRTVEAMSDGPLLQKGEKVRGHEFHWSIPCGEYEKNNAYRVVDTERQEGFHIGNTFASYIHLHLASKPSIARRFIETCCQFNNQV